MILVVFFAHISMNGLVLGNDPAVHLEKAQMFLADWENTVGKLRLDSSALSRSCLQHSSRSQAQIVLSNMILLVKMTAVLIDWLLFFSVYLIGSKFFGKKIGGIAAILLLLCFPMYEINLWGGYTSVLGLSFMFLLFLYLPLAAKDFGHVVITFLAGFSLVLSHQLAAFLTVLILPPVILFMLIKVPRHLPQGFNCTDSGRRDSVFPLLFPSDDRLTSTSLSSMFSSRKKRCYIRFQLPPLTLLW